MLKSGLRSDDREKRNIRSTEPEEKMGIIFPFYLEKRFVSKIIHHPYEEIAYELITHDNSYQAVVLPD